MSRRTKEIVMNKNNEGLQRITPRHCELEPCSNTAYWSFDGLPLCYEDMRNMAYLNGDNEEAFAPALAHAEEDEQAHVQ